MPYIVRLVFLVSFSLMSFKLLARAIIDADVLSEIKTLRLVSLKQPPPPISLLVFLNRLSEKKSFIEKLNKIPGLTVQDLGFMPAVAVQAPRSSAVINQIAEDQAVAQLTSYRGASLELDVSSQILKLAPSSVYPDVNNWWAHGYTGKNGVVGIIDTGIDTFHPALSSKKIVLRKEGGSGYSEYTNGVKEPHGTGVACIYTGNDEKYKGIAFGASTIVSGMAGEETPDISSIMLTLSSLDWMLNRSTLKPTIINYSMGNGKLAYPDSPEWSGLAKVMDYVINTQKILWVKSAGNMGYIEQTFHRPYASTLTVPGDNYNGLTVANMNTIVIENGFNIKVPDRNQHIIKSTSSRGPTPSGRRKPDLTAPGHDTRTCAPDPSVYHFNYLKLMDYRDGYRLMGGTSAAAPHVGASALLLEDAGITNPMAIKALLINSADTWTDEGTATQGHSEIMGSAWNRTYGWGYINMEKAFDQRNNIIEAELSVSKPVWEHKARLERGEKVTLVHERRVGYSKDGNEWQLSHLALEIIDPHTDKVLDSDNSPIDTVHQVSNCKREPHQKVCSMENQSIDVIIRVRLLSPSIDGSPIEPFALVTESPLAKQ